MWCELLDRDYFVCLLSCMELVSGELKILRVMLFPVQIFFNELILQI